MSRVLSLAVALLSALRYELTRLLQGEGESSELHEKAEADA